MYIVVDIAALTFPREK